MPSSSTRCIILAPTSAIVRALVSNWVRRTSPRCRTSKVVKITIITVRTKIREMTIFFEMRSVSQFNIFTSAKNWQKEAYSPC